jgi:CubicO group peptidase (beta-lactamase class C family)
MCRDWAQNQFVSTITFKDLLQHTSGFPDDSTPNMCGGSLTTYDILKSIIGPGGLSKPAPQPPDYSNCNFAMFRELLPIMIQGQTGQVGTTADGPMRAQASADFYVTYMNTNVFAPVGITSTLHCKPTTPASTAMLDYPFPPAAAPGWNGGFSNTPNGDWTLACGGGGWNMSANDLFLIVNDLANGGVLLPPTQKALMKADYLGWDNVVRSDCPNPYPCKNGNIGSTGNAQTNYQIWTYLGIFKCTMPVVVVVNSVLPASQPQDTIDLVAAAYQATATIPASESCRAGSF